MTQSLFLNEIQNSSNEQIPIWFMRQAGRYLPEYRELRKKTGTFLDLCYSPEAACEVTLQPIRRFDFDAAILFSDILVVPHALGQQVEFKEKQGPVLSAIRSENEFKNLSVSGFHSHLKPVYETIKKLKHNLPQNKALIGFSGAPFTVLCYMIEGKSSPHFDEVFKLRYENPSLFQELIKLLIQVTFEYLDAQIEAGVQVVQIFESWAQLLTQDDFETYIIKPTQQIVLKLRQKHPHIPIICFARRAGFYLLDYISEVKPDVIGLDQFVPLDWACANIDPKITIQGNLDPQLLLYGGPQLTQKVMDILDHFKHRKFIFNLGHGIDKETPIDHVHDVLNLIRQTKRY